MALLVIATACIYLISLHWRQEGMTRLEKINSIVQSMGSHPPTPLSIRPLYHVPEYMNPPQNDQTTEQSNTPRKLIPTQTPRERLWPRGRIVKIECIISFIKSTSHNELTHTKVGRYPPPKLTVTPRHKRQR
jgi:hypothetical protein